MKKQIRNTIALLLVLVQLFMLLPVLQPQAMAAETSSEDAAPVLNPVIEGTVRFGSFYFSGSKANSKENRPARDGVDYVSTFYYTDDYFAPPAVNPKAQDASSRTLEWTDLENRSLATLSKNFTVAVYGSKENTFPTTVWDNKDKNGKRFLADCGFDEDNIFVSSDFNAPTGKDTLGYIFGKKKIEVYDQKTHKNKEFTLVAVGIRGGGYGAEWASNLTIGNSNGPAAQSSGNSLKYRHYGFDFGAQKVLSDLRTYTSSISGDVKYWIVGYSRAGAIANLVAGDLTTNASQYGTTMDDIYGYTFEAPAAALTTDEAASGTNFPNIHNIINPMDAVPLVSPSEFNHCRLGVDYRLPFHGNVTDAENQTYFANMQKVLPEVAAIASIYDRAVTGNEKDKTADPSVTNSASYPYRSKIQMKSFGIMAYNDGFVNDVTNQNSKIAPNDGWYMDDFLKSFVTAFFSSRAWDARKLRKTTFGWNANAMTRGDHMSHEYEYVKYYQEAMRTLAYAVLKQPGMDIGSMDGLMDNAMSKLNFEDYLNGAGILITYGLMDATKGGIGYESRVGDLVSPMGKLLNSVVNGIDVFEAEDLDDVHAAINTVIPVLTWLYCDDHTFSGGEYLGTVFANLATILSAHSPELTVSWLMSLDDVFTSDYREITLPKNTAVSMKVLREGIDYTTESELQYLKTNGAKNADIPGVEVAAFLNGEMTRSEDDRISVEKGDDTFIIRYPGNLDVRFDVKTAGASFNDTLLQLADYQPRNVVNAKSACARAAVQSDDYNISNITDAWVVKDDVRDHDHYSMTQYHHTADADAVNGLTADIPLSGSETLHIMSWHGSNQVVDPYDTTYYVSLDKAPRSVVAEYTMETVLADNVKELPEGTDENLFSINDSDQLVWKFDPASSTASYAPISGRTFTAFNLTGLQSAAVEKAESVVTEGVYSTRQTVSVVPAASIYYDDSLLEGDVSVDAKAASPDYESIFNTLTSEGTAVDSSSLVAFKFTGTRIDLFMNTDENTGGVAAYLLNADGTKRIAGKLVSGKSANSLYNVPVVSFEQPEPNTYTLAIVVGAGKSFQLDGVRVYDGKKAAYASVRDSLLDTADWTGESEVTGTVYLDYGNNGKATMRDYNLSGPKGEVYLKAGKPGENGNGVAFTIKDFNASAASYRIGLSAVNGESVWVKINKDAPFEVKSSTHIFYDLNLTGPNVVIQAVQGSGILSVTDVEMTPRTLGAPFQPVVLSVSPQLMRFAESLNLPDEPVETAEPSPEVTAEPTAEPTPEATSEPTPEPTPEVTPEPSAEPGSTFSQLISSFILSLFGSISRMFGH
ncbi:MAG: hypothetical protein IJI27_02035 [Oscillospiraceae bacterium]|nr:hypothetical protein [Oscillospiraceae bacterium]